ncbi:MAG: hypothetical protein K1W32_14065 [Schaedlerella sp.]
MCLGLSMTAFAAAEDGRTIKEWESEDYMRRDIGPTGRFTNGHTSADALTVRDASGREIDYEWAGISKGTWESIKDEGKVQKIFADNGFDVNDKMDFIPMLTGTITVRNGVPEGGAVLTFGLKDIGLNSEDVKPGDTVYMMQETAPGSGVWEVFAAEIGMNYDIAVNVPRNGALVLVKVMSNGDVITLDKTTNTVIDRKPADNTTKTPGGQTSTSNTASAGTSPKTGEF